MEIYYNSFRLAVNAEPNIVIDKLKDSFVDFKADGKSNRFFTAQNHYIEIYENEDYDLVQSQDSENGFLYFKTNVDITVIDDSRTNPSKEMQLAKFLESKFLNDEIKQVKVVAEFSHLIWKNRDFKFRSVSKIRIMNMKKNEVILN